MKKPLFMQYPWKSKPDTAEEIMRDPDKKPKLALMIQKPKYRLPHNSSYKAWSDWMITQHKERHKIPSYENLPDAPVSLPHVVDIRDYRDVSGIRVFESGPKSGSGNS